MAIDKNNFWSTNYYNHPALTDEMVKRAESSLGVKLPDELIALLKVQNGGYTRGFVYPMSRPTSWSSDHVPLHELFGIVDESFDSGHNILSTAYMINEWGLPEKLVLLNGDGHWWIALDYRQGEIPSVTWFDTEMDQDIPIADSFAQFFDGLVPEDMFTG